MALISFLFCQCKTAFDVDTCHVISNISQLLPSVLWNGKFSYSNIVFQGQCPFPLLQCKKANDHFFFNSLPPSKLPDILRWENFLKCRPMVHCGANFRRRQYRPGWPSLPMTSFPLRGRIRLNQLLNNVRVNRNTKFKRLELLPLESVLQIQSKNLTSPTDNGHRSTPPPFAWPWWKWVPYPLGNFGQALSVFNHDMKIWFWQERAIIMLGLHSFRWLKDDWTDFSRRVNTGP